MRFDGRKRGFGRSSFGGSRDRERFDDTPKPVKAGEEYDVEIGEVGAKGDGIARVNNFVVFVADVKKGDKVKIKIKEVRNRFATGEKVGTADATAEAPVEADAPAEEAPAETTDAPAEEAPAEATEAPAEEAPAEEAPAEEAAPEADEAPAEETPAEEAPAEESTE